MLKGVGAITHGVKFGELGLLSAASAGSICKGQTYTLT